MKLTPAEYIVYKFQGVRRTSEALKIAPSTVSRWINGSGNVPSKYHIKIISIAKRYRMRITPNDLVYGRVVK